MNAFCPGRFLYAALSDRPIEGDPDAADPEADEALPVQPGEWPARVDEQNLDENVRRQIAKSRAKYDIFYKVIGVKIATLDAKASEISDELKETSRASAEVQARREELERQAELVDRMGEKLSL